MFLLRKKQYTPGRPFFIIPGFTIFSYFYLSKLRLKPSSSYVELITFVRENKQMLDAGHLMLAKGIASLYLFYKINRIHYLIQYLIQYLSEP